MKSLKTMIRDTLKGIFTDGKSGDITKATNDIIELIKKNPCLHWMDMNEWRKVHPVPSDLFLVYQPGYSLMVCRFVTGYGLININNGLSTHPEYVAYINLPALKPVQDDKDEPDHRRNYEYMD